MATKVGNEIFSEMVKGGSRTFFFDVKKSSKGSKYLIITESRKVGGEFKQERVFIFDDQLEPFLGGLKKALKFMKGSEG